MTSFYPVCRTVANRLSVQLLPIIDRKARMELTDLRQDLQDQPDNQSYSSTADIDFDPAHQVNPVKIAFAIRDKKCPPTIVLGKHIMSPMSL
jgi:hypothetical protein